MPRKYNENVIGFRCTNLWYRDFLNYLTAQGIDKRAVIEPLLQVLFRAMSAPELIDLPAREKFERALSILTTKSNLLWYK